MKAIILFAGLLTIGVYAQDITTTLEGNNIRASLSTKGVFFQNTEESGPGYESPKDGSNHLIYSNSFWFGAEDGEGNLKMCAMLYGAEGGDLYRGALKNDGSAEAPDEPFADGIYIVSKAEILYHSTNYAEPGYDVPDGISDWPAHGDVALGLAPNLAPFADLNGNGTYEPELGEYPEIRGDHAAYLILNDMGGPHLESAGDPLGIEVHFMFYQYEEAGDIENTTFVNVRVINRSSESYPEFIVANYMDSDIGFSEDEYIGCDSLRNVVYGYNADANDEGGAGGQPGYGENPPAVGIVSLNNTMHVAGYFDRLAGGSYNDPDHALDYWNYMNARWKNGAPFTYGGTGGMPDFGTPTRYMFSGHPTEIDETTWSEITASNPGGDRRMFMASESMSFEAGGVRCFDYAVITSRVGNHIENAAGIIDQAVDVKDFYDEQPDTYCDWTVGLPSEIIEHKLGVYPNPSNGQFTVQLEGDFDVSIFALDGRLVFNAQKQMNTVDVDKYLAAGTYVLLVTQDGKAYQEKIQIVE